METEPTSPTRDRDFHISTPYEVRPLTIEDFITKVATAIRCMQSEPAVSMLVTISPSTGGARAIAFDAKRLGTTAEIWLEPVK